MITCPDAYKKATASENKSTMREFSKNGVDQSTVDIRRRNSVKLKQIFGICNREEKIISKCTFNVKMAQWLNRLILH
jgi:hypothetical protein